jgi:hypothetical protein
MTTPRTKQKNEYLCIMKKWMLLLLSFAVVCFTTTSYGQGCSQCKMVAEQASELDEASFGTTINKGIIYLMAVPYFLLFLLFRKRIFAFIKGIKK